VALIMLHKRIPLAFQVRDAISEAEFDALRTGTHETFGLDHYLSIFTEPRLARAARNSIVLALTTSGLTTTLAFLLAYGINRGGVPLPNLVRYGALTPLVSPPVMVAFAAILLFGREGLVTRGLLDGWLGWIDADVSNLYGIEGVIVAQTVAFLPAALIVLDNVLARHDAQLEEAAAIQGATSWQIFRRITVPLSQPGLMRAAVLVFVLSMTDFANPLIIGQDFPVLAGILYDEMIGFQNTRLSAALAIWLIVPAITVYLLLERVGRRKRFGTAGAPGPSELPVPALARFCLSGLAYGLLLLIAVVYGSIVAGSLVRIWGVDYTFTLDWYTGADVAGFLSGNRGLQYVGYSLKVALLAAPLGGLLAVVIAYLAERVRVPGRNVLSFVTMLPAVLPGVIFGIGYIIAFNLPFGMRELALTGTMSILVLNILFANIFVGVLAGRAALQRLDASVDEAAEILGASLWQRFVRVVLPMIQHAALLGTMYIFIHAMTTLSAVIFLISPGNLLASFAIFDSVLNAYYGIACAMTVAILAIVFAAMGAMWLFERRGPAWARIGAQAVARV
ncbi:MAG TPA: iron ABC transporter permease, partial [Geminicoccaceae bacterium]|nr:iron ABC transporter permease [Geminicoccaceae bacterium]